MLQIIPPVHHHLLPVPLQPSSLSHVSPPFLLVCHVSHNHKFPLSSYTHSAKPPLRNRSPAPTRSSSSAQSEDRILVPIMGKEGSQPPAQTSSDFKLVGFSNFARFNPKSDRFKVTRFHHIEFWCTDASNTARRFSWGLGMPIVAKSDLSTGNQTHASYLCRSGHLCFLFTAPYSPSIAAAENLSPTSTASIPTFSHSASRNFAATHGLGVRAIAVEVEDATVAFDTSVAHGAIPVSPPVELDGRATIAEVHLYGDVVLRYVSYKNPNPDSGDSNPDLWFLPGFESMDELYSYPLDFGIRRLDHAVGNVPELGPVVSYLKSFTGFHEFAEFTAEDVGTAESGLNSVVLANNDEMVLLPLNEPVHGTKRKSQIQTYLDHNEGAGLQHLALVSEDIFRTLREMRKRSGVGGFEFMPSPPPTYYKNLKNRAGDVLTDEQIKECEELGILVDRDDQGTLLQIFTKPVGDRWNIVAREEKNAFRETILISLSRRAASAKKFLSHLSSLFLSNS